jgi:hypothetical protein
VRRPTVPVSITVAALRGIIVVVVIIIATHAQVLDIVDYDRDRRRLAELQHRRIRRARYRLLRGD